MDIAASFDWLSPSYALLRDAIAGDAYKVKIDAADALEYQSVIKKAGIESWGWTYYMGEVVFSIHKKDARRVGKMFGLEEHEPKTPWFWIFMLFVLLFGSAAIVLGMVVATR